VDVEISGYRPGAFRIGAAAALGGCGVAVLQPVDSSILHEIVRVVETRRKVPERVQVRNREYQITYLEDHQRRLEEALHRYDADRLNMLFGQLASKVKYQMLRRVPERASKAKAAKPAARRPARPRAKGGAAAAKARKKPSAKRAAPKKRPVAKPAKRRVAKPAKRRVAKPAKRRVAKPVKRRGTAAKKKAAARKRSAKTGAAKK
jgi:hypothetical protein